MEKNKSTWTSTTKKMLSVLFEMIQGEAWKKDDEAKQK